MSTEEGNKIIAEFMGAAWRHKYGFPDQMGYEFQSEPYSNGATARWYDASALLFHSSLEWLKPAVDRFLAIQPDEFNYDVNGMTELKKCQASIRGLSIASTIETVYNHLLVSVKWYLEYKKPQAVKPQLPNRIAEWKERDLGSVYERMAKDYARMDELEKQIGELPDGAHPDERKPRAETWLKERENWQSEVNNLRDKVREQELIIYGLEEGAAEWKLKCIDLEQELKLLNTQTPQP